MTSFLRRLALAGVTMALAAVAGCDPTPDYLKEEARRMRLAELGVELYDSTGTYELAGMSTHREIDIPLLRPEDLGADTLDPAFDVFALRCGSCHAVPAPGAKPAYLWDAALSRMRKNAEDAGLMPMGPDDEALVRRFLREHAADRK